MHAHCKLCKCICVYTRLFLGVYVLMCEYICMYQYECICVAQLLLLSVVRSSNGGSTRTLICKIYRFNIMCIIFTVLLHDVMLKYHPLSQYRTTSRLPTSMNYDKLEGWCMHIHNWASIAVMFIKHGLPYVATYFNFLNPSVMIVKWVIPV